MKRTTDNILIEWLVLGAQSGDADAIDRLVALMRPKLLRYAARVLDDIEAAQDVVQMAFEVLSRDLRKMRDPAAFSAWIYRVTHNKCVDLIRQRQNHRAAHSQIQASLETQSRENLESAHSVNDQLMDLERLFARLNTQQYQLAHLFYLEGFSLREVSDLLSVPEGTVKSRLFQLRKQLKPLLLGDTHE